jgi:hypothetical protein
VQSELEPATDRTGLEEKRRQLAALPGMTTLGERWQLRELVRNELSGAGAVIDLGCWLGSLSASMADGLRENRSLLSRGNKVHAYDRFVWEADYMDRYWQDNPLVDRPADQTSFVDRYKTLMGPWLAHIEVHVADLHFEKWYGAPIELLSVDAMKSVDLSKNIIKEFFPFLNAPHGFLFHQDFCHFYTWWIHLYHYLLRDHFAPVQGIDGAGGVLFKVVRPLERDALAQAAEADLADPVLAERAFAFSMRLVGDVNRVEIARAYERCELHHDRDDRAQRIRKTYGLANPIT